MNCRKTHQYLVAIFILASCHATAQTYLGDMINPLINQSNDNNVNVNRAAGTPFQDVKRAAVILYVPNQQPNTLGYPYTETGTLVNTTRNCIDPATGSKLFYVLTSSNLVARAGTDNFDVYVSADYEMSDAMDRGSDVANKDITRVYKSQVKVLVDDPGANIALLQLMTTEFAENHNLYAAGWDLDPIKQLHATIAHPMSDHKKLFVRQIGASSAKKITSPTKVSVIRSNQDFWLRENEHYWKIDGTSPSWAYSKFGPQWGSEGASILNKDLKIAGVLVGASQSGDASVYSSISNSWLPIPGGSEPSKGLMDYLDPGHLWINKVPGGYLDDLLPVPVADFEMILHSGDEKKDKRAEDEKLLFMKDVTGSLKQRENYVSRLSGLKLGENQGNARVFVSVTTASMRDPDYLLYGAYAQQRSLPSSSAVAGFEDKGWDVNTAGSAGFPAFPRRGGIGIPGPDMSTNFKQAAVNLTAQNLKKGYKIAWTRFSQVTLPIEIKLFRQNDGIPEAAKIQTLGIPDKPPMNAVELFAPERLENIWQSNKYPGSSGNLSSSLYITGTSIYQNKILIKSIATQDNGGYLNLVNPNFLIETVETSYIEEFGADPIDNNVHFNISIKKSSVIVGTFYYKIWMDFFPDIDPATHHYNFVEDPIPHPIELLAQGSGTGSPIIVTVRMPDNLQLDMQPGDSKICRMRIAVSNNDDVEQDGQYEYGEVEDYLVKIHVPDPIVESIDIHMPLNNTLVDVAGEESTANAFGDDDVPMDEVGSCGSVGSFGDFCYDGNRRRLGSSSLHFGGTGDYVSLDNNKLLLNNAFTARTVSLWVYSESNSGIQDIYDEGDDANGIGLRINNGNMELGVQNGNNIQKVSGAMPVNQWVLVTGIFNNGKLSLYLDETMVAANANVGFTSVPVHLGAAGLGATNGTNAFDQANNHFNGWVDELKVYNIALPESEIEFMSVSTTAATTPAMVQSEKQDDIQPGTEKKSGRSATGLIVYPNPSKGDFNLITEVKQAGPVTIQVIDMSGRVVYDKTINGVGAGFQQVALKALHLKAATYIVKAESRGNVQTGKLVIEN
ncbi:MAG: LamG-like jellyroll fold domain-containing protein [Bacteroidota bacterium]